MDYDVSVIGLGRVGLPLALSFASKGLRVLGVDKDVARLEALRSGRMPFEEPGADELPAGVRLAPVVLRARRRRRRGAQHRAHRRDADLLAHRDRHGRHPLGAWTTCCRCCAPGHLVVLRSTVAPGTTEFVAGYLEKHRGFVVGEDVFVAHVPERIAAAKFFAEIETLPCIVGGVGEGSGARAAELFSVFDAPIVQTTPVQAELAKIWANILRYATFALPNLLMMDCERYERERLRGHRPDQPRLPARRDGAAGLHRGDLPAEGLRVLARSARRRRACCSRSRASTSPCRRSWSTACAGASGRLAAREEGRRAGPGVQARHRRRARLAVAQAHPAARARARRRRRPRPDGPDADAGLRLGRARRRRRRRGHQPLRLLDAGGAGVRAVARPRPRRSSSTPGTPSGRPRSSPTPPSCARSPARSTDGPGAGRPRAMPS